MRESQPVSNRGFATTRWSVVLAAGSDDRDDARTALAELCAAYWRPLFEYARRRGLNSDDAADRTQSFFADLITRQTVQKADEQRGRFRTFLVTAFQRFLLNEYDRSQTQKRGGDQNLISIEQLREESSLSIQPSDRETPELAFERRWATTLLNRVLELLRDSAVKKGRGELFDRCRNCLIGEPDESYEAIGKALGMTESAVKVAVHRMRQEYRDLLFREVRQTLSDENELAEEIRHLLSVVQNPR